jgi:dihydropteroate synthase
LPLCGTPRPVDARRFPTDDPYMSETLLLLTGKLAEPALRQVVAPLVEKGLAVRIEVLGISVAALMHVDWVARKLPSLPGTFSRVLVPGWCQGELGTLATKWGCPVERGPKDLLDLPEFLGRGSKPPADLSRHSIEILAEINHAPRLSEAELMRQSLALAGDGADLIDLGCIPGESWRDIGDAVRRLRDAGLRVSVDSFDRDEVERAVSAGAELVLSANATNRDWAFALPAEFVLVPDDPRELQTLDATQDAAKTAGRRFRLDPILEPVGFGFAASLDRYARTRRTYPEAPMLMGIGNVTELAEVDSAGVNFLLAAICEELRIGSVLTTQVIHWARTSVKEFDIARRLAAYAIRERRLPKHVDAGLVMLRDGRPTELGAEGLAELGRNIRDPNYRIFAERGEIHVLNRDGYWHGRDPYEVFDRLGPLEPSHAFYLGYEFAKAKTALTLGKRYRQDEALAWGFMTEPEESALHRRKQERNSQSEADET